MDDFFQGLGQGVAMSEHVLLQLAGVLILGIAIQWFAWRARFPAILLLLAAGLVLGPGSAFLATHGFLAKGFLDPDELFGNLLLPAVSLAVALILFEGGLTLNLREQKSASLTIWLLVTIGAVIAFGVIAFAAHLFLGVAWSLAILLGAILVVTGPTVIGPLLRHVRPAGKVGAILKWEGIIIDPMGAMAAILVFQAIASKQIAPLPMITSAAAIMVVGTLCGIIAAGIVVLCFSRRWVPDFLQNSFVLVMVLLAFAVANAIRHESGLFAVTMMGLTLGNQQRAHIHHVREFKESLTVLLISALFIVLGARLTPAQLAMVPWGGMIAFLAVLILVARPLAVVTSTLFSSLTWAERVFLAGVAPRGIVAAAVASVFALRMSQEHFAQAEMLVPITFATIIGSVTFYGLLAGPLARALHLSRPGAEGFLIAGAGFFGRMLAQVLMDEGQLVLLVDTNRAHIATARLQGMSVLHGSVTSRFVMEEAQFSPLGRFLALTPNDELNALAAMQYQRTFSRADVFQMAPDPRSNARQEKISGELRGRVLFSADLTFSTLEERAHGGYAIKRTQLTTEFTFDKFKEMKESESVLLFIRNAVGTIHFFTADFPPVPVPGDIVFSLAPPKTRSTSVPAEPIEVQAGL